MCKAFDDWREELLQEGRELGWTAGRSEGEFLAKIKQVRANLKKNYSVKMLADFMGEKQENIEMLRKNILDHPDMNDEEVLAMIKEKWNYELAL